MKKFFIFLVLFSFLSCSSLKAQRLLHRPIEVVFREYGTPTSVIQKGENFFLYSYVETKQSNDPYNPGGNTQIKKSETLFWVKDGVVIDTAYVIN